MSHYLFQKRRGSKIYWYLGKSERTPKGVRRTWQKYLGTAESIMKLTNSLPELQIETKAFGSIACMLSVAKELGIEDIIERVVPDKNYKLSVYEHMLLQSIGRFNEPLSKKKSVKWYKDSVLPLIWKKDFSSVQTIFNQFDKVVKATENKIPQIEEEICKALLEKGIKPSSLIWDPTNFFTYIEEGEELAKKGASKEKRYDKNLINLGLVVSQENIPLMHTVYEGNKREIEIMSGVVDTIFSRLKKLGAETEEMVFVFDRGNNSEDNVANFKQKFHFIGALKKSQLTHLYDINLDKFEKLYESNGENTIMGYATTEIVYGEKHKVVITYNEATAIKQKGKTEEAVKKIKEKFNALEKNINNRKKGRKTKTKSLAAKICNFLYKQYRSLFSWDFNETEQKFSWELNEEAYMHREKTCGKTVLFTDLNDWPSKDIAKTYNSKAILESDFKDLKDKLLIPVKPIYSRLDDHLKAHIFVCVLSLTLYRYMLWKLKDLELSEKEIVKEIRSMRLAFVKQKDSNSVRKVLECMSKNQMEIYSRLRLGEFLPN